MQRKWYPIDALVDEIRQLGLSLEVAEDAAGDPAAVEELHWVQRHHLGRPMDPHHHRQAPALRTPGFRQTSEFRLKKKQVFSIRKIETVLGLIGLPEKVRVQRTSCVDPKASRSTSLIPVHSKL